MRAPVIPVKTGIQILPMIYYLWDTSNSRPEAVLCLFYVFLPFSFLFFTYFPCFSLVRPVFKLFS